MCFLFFFFKQKTAYEMRISDWSSDVCSSDLMMVRLLAGELDAATAAMAKYWTSEALGRVTDECLQLHGGYGYMAEYPIARMWTNARVARIYAGTNEIMKTLIARAL